MYIITIVLFLEHLVFFVDWNKKERSERFRHCICVILVYTTCAHTHSHTVPSVFSLLKINRSIFISPFVPRFRHVQLCVNRFFSFFYSSLAPINAANASHCKANRVNVKIYSKLSLNADLLTSLQFRQNKTYVI